ncbi:16S rRNA (guanine(966)-N(2))-methyltransferase RsmD [Levilactobacillus humaensis]|uniref:16S rRNA (guanine(966)-N(2))-methyltransferase RsmD n=1 Tax=Levilactobacillus humaensis TaxID=2950375 RepID=UPI0021C3D9E1|nr:16S rRNA (guanine(966)-N(2))-methyltransferase RsmD [Levilactobacillus humaensis]
MRIVAGEFGGRRLKAVPGMATRPTTDKVKEALFNIIGPYFDGGRSLDLFAGSGGLSIEGVSRGIDEAVLIDRQYAAIQTIRDNVEVTKAPEKFVIIKRDANRALKELATRGDQFNLVYFDPPYAQQKIVEQMGTLRESNLLKPHARIVCETDQKAKLPEDVPGYDFIERRDYGITELTIYALGSEA